jgi:hypothetical protein
VPLVAPAAALAAALQSDQPISLTGKLGRARQADPIAVPVNPTTPSGSSVCRRLPPSIEFHRAAVHDLRPERGLVTTCTQGFSNKK